MAFAMRLLIGLNIAISTFYLGDLWSTRYFYFVYGVGMRVRDSVRGLSGVHDKTERTRKGVLVNSKTAAALKRS
jgi:hypothetical protein